jgi:hypothetical protein
MSEISPTEYERIFGANRKKVDYSEQSIEVRGTPKEEGVVAITEDGHKQDKLTPYQKNKLYKEAKQIREQLPDQLCTKSECWNPIDKNVQKMIHGEMKNPKLKQYQVAMRAIGADPKDCETEQLRRVR